MAKLSQKSLTARVYKFIEEKELILPGEKVLVAVSGGPDSVCLFDILCDLKDKLKLNLTIIHYNHKQRGAESDKDAKFVSQLAKGRGVDYLVEEYDGKNKKLSEDEAREARYAFFERILGERSGDRLVIAHTLNDQAETIIMRLIRGASILGLSSIPLQRKKISRPLLKFSRTEVLEHLSSKRLSYRLDKSNENLDYSRNLIRHKIIPELEEINSKAVCNLVKSMELASDQSKLLSDIATKAYNDIAKSGDNCITIECRKFAKHSPLLQIEIIKLGLINLLSIRDVGAVHYQSIIRMIKNNTGKKKIVVSKHLQVSLKEGIIYIERID